MIVKLMNSPMSFKAWKTQYAHRVKLIAGVKTLASALEMLPHDDILEEAWRDGELPNDAADNEMTEWEE